MTETKRFLCSYLPHVQGGQTTQDSIRKVALGHSSKKVAPIIETLRQAQGKEETRKLKAKLPAAMPSTTSRVRGDSNCITHHTGMICVDFDDVANPPAMRDDLSKSPHTLLSSLSVSANGVFAIALVNPIPNTKAQHVMAFEAVIRAFREYTDIPAKTDEACKNVERLRFISSDPDFYYNEDAKPLVVDYDQMNKTTQRRIPTNGHADTADQDLKEALGFIDPDAEYKTWIDTGMALKSHDENTGWQMWVDWSAQGAKFKPGECEKKWATFPDNGEIGIGTVFHHAKNAGYTNGKATNGKATNGKATNGKATNGGHVFEVKNAATLAKVLELEKIAVRYNLRGQCIEFSVQSSKFYSANDRMLAHFRQEFADTYKVQAKSGVEPLYWGRDLFQDHINAIIFKHEVDPFIKWLDTLPQWDGTERLNYLLRDLFECEHNKLTAWASRYPFIGAIQRGKEPGCKLDEFPVLIGEQGIGKSAYLHQILPKEHRDQWFSDSLNIRLQDKGLVESTLGRVICEISEMAGNRVSDIEQLKAYLTRQDDGSIRLAYRHNPEPMPRRFVFVGTSNNAECLPNDFTGLRRFVPVNLNASANVEAFIDKQRDQLWAEALHRYNAGTRANLPRELIPQQREVAEQARSKDELFEDTLGTAIRQAEKDAASQNLRGFSMTALQALISDDWNQFGMNSKKVAAYMRKIGLQDGRTKSGRYWYYP